MKNMTRNDKNREKLIAKLLCMGMTKVVFSATGELIEAEFLPKSVENIKKVSNSKHNPVRKTEEQLQTESDLEKLRKARALDDLMLEDPVAYEEAVLMEGMTDGDDS